jgi:predicted DNA-binding transcriptional regulator AlpA
MTSFAASPAVPTAIKKPAKPITGPAARPSQAAVLFGVHISTIWRWVAERDDFPKPRKVGPRTTVFVTAELIAFRDRMLGAQS